jgi:hypothetical protein
MATITLRTTGDNKENIEYVLINGAGGSFRWGGPNGHAFSEKANLPNGEYTVTYSVPGFENSDPINVTRSGTLTIEENENDYSISFD